MKFITLALCNANTQFRICGATAAKSSLDRVQKLLDKSGIPYKLFDNTFLLSNYSEIICE